MSRVVANRPALIAGLDAVARWLASITGAAVVVLAVLICIDIGGRSLLHHSLQGTDELGGYVLAFIGSLGLAYTLLRKNHPRIDIGLRFLPRWLHAPLHILAHAALCGMGAFMAWHAWGELSQTIRFGAVTNTPLQTPLWVPQGLWVFGTGFFALTAFICTLHGLILLFKRDPETVTSLYGPATVDEELEAYRDDHTPEGQP